MRCENKLEMKTGSETILRTLPEKWREGSEGEGEGELNWGGECCLLLLRLALYMVYKKDMTPAEQVADWEERWREGWIKCPDRGQALDKEDTCTCELSGNWGTQVKLEGVESGETGEGKSWKDAWEQVSLTCSPSLWRRVEVFYWKWGRRQLGRKFEESNEVLE